MPNCADGRPDELDPTEAGALVAGHGLDLRQAGEHFRLSERSRKRGDQLQHRRSHGMGLGQLAATKAQDHPHAVYPRQGHERTFVPALFADRDPHDLGVDELVGEDQRIDQGWRQGRWNPVARRQSEACESDPRRVDH